MTFRMATVYFNTEFCTKDQALIPTDDRGFRFGDGVFETIAVHQGVPYQWELHLERLTRGLEDVRITFDTSDLESICRRLIEKNAVHEGMLRITISRGAGSRGYLPHGDNRPTLLIETFPVPERPPGPVKLWHTAIEKISPKALPVSSKLSQGLNSTLARMDAIDHGCFDALQCSASGAVAETSSANIFWLQGDTLFTPALSVGALNGTTRDAVIRLSPWSVETGLFPISRMMASDAVFITNAAWQVLPVHSLQPQGWQWNSEHAANTLNGLLQEDIKRYVTAQSALV